MTFLRTGLRGSVERGTIGDSGGGELEYREDSFIAPPYESSSVALSTPFWVPRQSG